MNILANVLVSLVALLHLYFLVLEMFLWTKPKGLRVFNQSLEKAKASATLAANQGLYNGFLAAGLIWGLVARDPSQARDIKMFFLICVTIAGLYGGWSVNRRILFIQAMPAVVGMLLVML